MNEPANHTALVDRGDDTWIRVDECPGRYGTWWPLTDEGGGEFGGCCLAATLRDYARIGLFALRGGGAPARAARRS